MTTTLERSDAASSTVDGAVPRRGLASTLVRYDRRPDRRTIYPPGLSDVPKMSTWLTANDDAFVDLEAVR